MHFVVSKAKKIALGNLYFIFVMYEKSINIVTTYKTIDIHTYHVHSELFKKIRYGNHMTSL